MKYTVHIVARAQRQKPDSDYRSLTLWNSSRVWAVLISTDNARLNGSVYTVFGTYLRGFSSSYSLMRAV